MNSAVVKLLKQQLHFNNLKVFTYLYIWEKCTLSICLAPTERQQKAHLGFNQSASFYYKYGIILKTY